MLDYPQVYDSTGKRLAILNQATDVIITDQIITDTNGQSTLTFNLPYNDPKLDLFDVEDQARVAGMVFVIRTIQNGWDSQGTLKAQIYAEALWYELSEYDPIQPVTMTGATAQSIMEAMLATSDWSVGTVEISSTADFNLAQVTNPLAAVMSLPSIFGGELQFDTINKTVSLLTQVGSDNGLLYAYRKNLQSNQRVVDSRYLYTRMRPYGANDENGNPLTITSVNGTDYIENYQWYDATGKPHKVKCYEQTNDQITDPVALKLWAVSILNVLSMPRITYTMQVILDKTDGIPNIGDTVRVYDPKLKVTLASRLAQRTYNVLQPWLSTVQLSTALYSLTDQLTSQSQSTNQQINSVIQTSSAGLDLLNSVTTPSGKLDLTKSEGRLPDSQCSIGPGTVFASGYDPSDGPDIPLASTTVDGLMSKEKFQVVESLPEVGIVGSGGEVTYKVLVSDTVFGGLMSADDVKKTHSLPADGTGAVAEATESEHGLMSMQDKQSLNQINDWITGVQALDPEVSDPHNTGSDARLSDVLANFEQRITALGG